MLKSISKHFVRDAKQQKKRTVRCLAKKIRIKAGSTTVELAFIH